MTDLKKCDFCGAIVKPKEAYEFGLYDDEGMAQDDGDLCPPCYKQLSASIDKLRNTREERKAKQSQEGASRKMF